VPNFKLETIFKEFLCQFNYLCFPLSHHKHVVLSYPYETV
jgi:hypothetical protein